MYWLESDISNFTYFFLIFCCCAVYIKHNAQFKLSLYIYIKILQDLSLTREKKSIMFLSFLYNNKKKKNTVLTEKNKKYKLFIIN